jgi:hypothetical protein
LAGKTGTTVKDIEFMSKTMLIKATRRLPRRRESSSDASNLPPFGN